MDAYANRPNNLHEIQTLVKIKKIKHIKVNSYSFNIIWDNSNDYGSFSYGKKEIRIGTKTNTTDEIWMIICHEIMEIVALEMHVRFDRPDCATDYLFVYDHRQHDTMMNMHSSLIKQFIS